MPSGRILNDWIASYMDWTEESEPPKTFHLWAAISTIASALQRKCWLQWGMLTFYPNMYISLVAPSGKCRKGTAMGPTRDLLDALGIKMAAEATTRESLIREMKKVNSAITDPVTGDQSYHSSLTVHSQELTVFLGYDNKQLMMDLTDWYDCRGRWTYRTKTQGEDDIIGVWVNLFGASTPELIQSTMPMDAIGGGLTSRMIFVYENQKYKTSVYPESSPALYADLLRDLEQINMMSGQFKVAPDFIDLWADWYPAQEYSPPFDDPKLAGYIERRPNHVMKLSMILSASRSSDLAITQDDLRRSIHILELAERKMPMVFRGMGACPISNVMSRVMSMIALEQRIDEPKLVATFYNDADDFTMDRILKTLAKMEYIKVITRDGKPREIVYTGKEEVYEQEGNTNSKRDSEYTERTDLSGEAN